MYRTNTEIPLILLLVLVSMSGKALAQPAPHPIGIPAVRSGAPLPSEPIPARVGDRLAPRVEVVQVLPDSVGGGETITASLIVTNVGASPVEDVRLYNDWGPEVDFVSGEPTPERDGSRFSWALGRLEPDERRAIRVEIVAHRGAATPISSRARVSFSASVVSVVPVVEPTLAVSTHGPKRVRVGQPAPLEIHVRNVGDATAHGVVVRDMLPPGLRHPLGSRLENTIGDLEPGADRRVRLTVTPETSGELSHRIEVIATNGPRLEREFTLNVPTVDWRLEAQPLDPRRVGYPTNYRFTVRHDAAVPVGGQGSRLIARPPSGIPVVHASEGATWNVERGEVVWDVPKLEPGHSAEFVLTGIAQQPGEHVCHAVLETPEDRTRETVIKTVVYEKEN